MQGVPVIVHKVCNACGKVFPMSHDHVYKDVYKHKQRVFCSWTCFNHREVEEDRKRRVKKAAEDVKEGTNRYESPYAICPFYKAEKRDEIFCEGLFKNSKIHFAISPPEKKVRYKRKYCEKNYERCPIAKMHFRINSGQDEDDGKI